MDDTKYAAKAPLAPHIIAGRVLNMLSVGDPLSVADLSISFPDTSKDSIQYILDAMNALGVVTPIRYVCNPRTCGSEDSKFASSSYPIASSVQYTISGFVKVLDPIEFNTLLTSIVEAKRRLSAVRSRNNRLLVSWNCLLTFFSVSSSLGFVKRNERRFITRRVKSSPL
jgi:hypothetical protein